MLSSLAREERLRLLKFVCSVAWADLEVQPEETTFVHKLVDRLNLDAHDRAHVDDWLSVPPPAEEVDPGQIPAEHRALFLSTVRDLIEVDGAVEDDEKASLGILIELLDG